MTEQTITRSHHACCTHKLKNHSSACRMLHGHDYFFELTFTFTQVEEIGYALDFAEIKRVGCAWIDDFLDHGAIFNPTDTKYINPCIEDNLKLWLMSLNGEGEFCNPSVENIAKEVYMVMEILFEKYNNLCIKHLRVFETEKCWTDCTKESISDFERKNFYQARYNEIKAYAESKGIVEYDDRKIQQ